MRRENLKKFFLALRPVIFLYMVTAIFHIGTLLAQGIDALVKNSYEIGYVFGSFL